MLLTHALLDEDRASQGCLNEDAYSLRSATDSMRFFASTWSVEEKRRELEGELEAPSAGPEQQRVKIQNKLHEIAGDLDSRSRGRTTIRQLRAAKDIAHFVAFEKKRREVEAELRAPDAGPERKAQLQANLLEIVDDLEQLDDERTTKVDFNKKREANCAP